MQEKDKYINIADLKRKLRYIFKQYGVNKFIATKCFEMIGNLPFYLIGKLETTLNVEQVDNEWIHVTNSLPGHNQKVLALLINENNVKRKYEVITARYDIFGKIWYDCENHVYRNSKNIPYWQELPNVPNKERLIKNEV